MAEIKAIAEEQKKLKIEHFGGVDFSSNNSKMSLRRSPDAVNMIADDLYFPCKRTGYKKVIPEALTGNVNGMYKWIKESDQTEHILAHIGTKVYEIFPDGSDPEEISFGYGVTIADHSSVGFYFDGWLFILDGTTYLQYSGTLIDSVYHAGYSPETYIACAPSGPTDSNRKDPKNLISPYQVNTFNGNGTTATYKLSETDIDDVPLVKVNGSTLSLSAYSFSDINGTVTFASGHIPPSGTENVYIQFYKELSTDVTNQINQCTNFGVFGGSNDTRVFLTGNPNYRNMDWESGLFEPRYFPDTGYTLVGADSSGIIGYTRQYDTQIIIKEDNDVDATQYLRTFDLDSNNEPVYALQQGAQGVGAVAPRSFSTLGDVPMFLSKIGVYGVMGTSVAMQRSIQPKSTLINNKLLKETNLENAVAISFENKYYLALNNHVYVADGNQTFSDGVPGTQYEWYYWEDLPITCFLEHDGYLFFGTTDGRICRFYKNDETGAYSDDGDAISCKWTTPFINFGKNTNYKTIQSTFVTVKPYSHADLLIKYGTEKINSEDYWDEVIAFFDLDYIDFDSFVFNTSLNARTLAIKQKIRKVEMVQYEFSNSTSYEFLGILEIGIVFVENGPLKN